MNIVELEIPGVWFITSKVNRDERGQFLEWFKFDSIFTSTNFSFSPKQANFSHSNVDVMRGMHYSLAADGQSKLVLCASGAIQDVVLDSRIGSPTFGRWLTRKLEAGSGQALLISGGLAHGFLSLLPDTKVVYLVSSEYSPEDEFEINPLDPDLDIKWLTGGGSYEMSTKDRSAPSLLMRQNEGKLPKYTSP
jgi:dTDP-4-dehydrorhamnose 3,5-epimerase